MLEHLYQFFLSLHIDEYALQLPLLAEWFDLQQLNKVIKQVLLLLNDGYKFLPLASGVEVDAEIERRGEL